MSVQESVQELPQGVLPGTISLIFGHPDATTLPVDDLRAAAEAMFRSSQARLALQYGPEQGSPALIDYLVGKLNREEGLDLSSGNLMIVPGSTCAVDMIARLYAGRDGVVLVEAPTYHDALQVLRDHGADLRPVPVGDDGLVVEALVAQLKRLRREGKPPLLLYTIPNFQNPSGVTLATARREALLDLAQEHGFLIVEDDVYGDLAFEGEVPPSFYALAGGQGVLRIGSFSKILAAGLRLGWLIAAPEHIHRFTHCGVLQMGGGANPFVARVVAEYCRAGYLEPHIAQLRQVYRHRRDVTLTALEHHMPEGVTWTRPRGGFFVWLTLPEGMDAGRLREAARQQGVLFVPGAGFFAGGGGERNLRLAFSFVPPDEIEKAVGILGQAIREMGGGRA
ncbi:MAG: PLP-dependent aminotransferase family protein [Anaerolineae bacterium]|nr:MAG: PLP-dependent aminotransferase family protein [Anaerolineae bacterium]